jgi:tetratricopeptide (TPR) repeat protein
MPESARILKFPERRRFDPLSEEDSRKVAEIFLARSKEERSETPLNADLLFGVVSVLRDKAEIDPGRVFGDAIDLYGRLLVAGRRVGLFDETEYLLGEFALLAGRCSRHLGRASEGELWLDRAESAIRHTVNPAPALANTAFARLALRYSTHRYEEVVELVPSLIRSYESLGMPLEGSKALFLEAMALKQLGRRDDALSRFERLVSNANAIGEPAVLGQSYLEIGEYHGGECNFELAISNYQQALAVLRPANRPIAIANLKWSIGETLRKQGNFTGALQALRESHSEYSDLNMPRHVVMLRLAVADTLISVNRPREAEWEILAALPTIEEQRMVPEGFAAVALLKESVRRRKTDPNALRELREHLQANQ